MLNTIMVAAEEKRAPSGTRYIACETVEVQVNRGITYLFLSGVTLDNFVPVKREGHPETRELKVREGESLTVRQN